MELFFIVSSPSEKGKGKRMLSQKEKVYNYLLENTATMSMVDEATGVKQKNICRIYNSLLKEGRVYVAKVDKCEVTGKKAMYLSTNPLCNPHRNQLKINFYNDKD